ncbi:MAG: dehydrogenase, partial [Thalassolituus maritimus]
MNNRLKYHLELLNETLSRIEKAAANESGVIDADILQQFRDVIDQLTEHRDSAYEAGQDLFSKIGTHQPQLMPAVDRALLWFFGGECMHFLSDEEITRFQHLDEMAAEAEAEGKEYDYRSAGR